MRIYHITSVHTRYDTRIFMKECMTLAKSGYDVSLIVCDGNGDEEKNNVKIIDAGNCHNFKRIKRMLKGPDYIDKVLKNKIENCSNTIIHFHDPELLFLGKKYARKGCKVIYDSHENVPKQILSKPYLNSTLAKLISVIFTNFEKSIVKVLSGVITVTEDNVNRFKRFNDNIYLVRNFPVLSSFLDLDVSNKKMSFLYNGGVTEIRGAREICEAAASSKTEINFYGPVQSKEFENLIKNQYSIFHGAIPQCELFEINKTASVGLCTLHKVPNYLDSYPIKLFEYMAAGMAVIASDIPMWKEIIEKYECGICVDPQNVEQICDAILFMKNNPNKVRKMGENGRKAVFEHFSWKNESKVLLECYKKVELK